VFVRERLFLFGTTLSLLFDDGPDFWLFGNPSLQLKPKEGGNSKFEFSSKYINHVTTKA
jgi:hypothetical protein